MKEIDDLLIELYYKQHNYDSVKMLYQKAKAINPAVKMKDVDVWLKKQATYQLNFSRPSDNKKFLPIYAARRHHWQIDLTFLPTFKGANASNYVLFTAIHINSRFAYASYATNKRGPTILDLFKVFSSEYTVKSVDGDLGSEFINKPFIAYLKSQHIEYHFFKSDSHKLGIINRFHRTLKTKITRHFSATGKTNWTQVLPQIISNYNTTFHRGIKAAPKVVFDNEVLEDVIVDEKIMKTEQLKSKESKFNVGDSVRVATTLKTFESGSMIPRYSEEVYTIVKLKTNSADVLGLDGAHTFKKSRLLVIPHTVENYKAPVEATVAKRQGRIERRVRREDLIDAPMDTRTRGGGGKS